MKKKEFDAFLDAEIEDLRSEIQRPGWTSWALTGALAALVWILISLVEQGGYSLKEVASLLVVISLLSWCHAIVKSRVSSGLPSERPKGRLVPMNIISANVPVIILSVVEVAFLTIVINRLSTELGSAATSISLAAISLLWVGVLASIVAFAMRIPVPFNSRNRGIMIGSVVYLVVILISIWYQVRFLWISPGVASLYDVRFALVIAAIYFLLCKLVYVPRGAITLDVLKTIRRELLLERIELETATQQVDIALSGMRASDLLESYVSTLLSLYRDASAEFSKSVSCIDKIEKSIPEAAGKLSPGQVPVKRQDLEILTSSLGKARTIITVDIPRAYRPIGQRMMVLKSTGFLKESDELQDLDRKLKAVQAELDEQIKEFTEKFAGMRKKVEAGEVQMD